MEKNLPPLKGEVARRAGGVRRPSPAKGESPGFLRIQTAFPLPAEAFQRKAGTPQSRLRRASSPCRGALERAYFRQLTPATPLIHKKWCWLASARLRRGIMGGSGWEIRALAPLQGELSAQLTEGFRLGPRPSPAEGESPGFLRIRAAFPLPAEAFQGKAGTPQSRLRRASSPCRGALERAYFRQLTPATPLIHKLWYSCHWQL